MTDRPLVIDCGACIGSFLKHFDHAIVHAFEPFPKNAAYLRRRYPQVTVHEKAVTGKSGERLPLFLHRDPSQAERLGAQGSSLFAAKSNVNPEHFLWVETVALSDFLPTLNARVNLLKIDTEGSEFTIFEDLLNSGTFSLIDAILYEDHRQRHPDLFDLKWAADVERAFRASFKGTIKQLDF
jgi:FkbM family methyltransferase